MAAVVSHAMRRYPTTPPDTVYSYGLRAEGPQKQWSSTSEEGESSLSRSMRYADPWLYGSVRAPGGLVLAPAFVLCTCSDYLKGTKRTSKKGPTTCKKCKGTRLPISPGDAKKFGTVRCYPTAITTTPLRAGTMRVSSSPRPSILPPAADPYDLMRRSRLSVPLETTSQFRARSISPSSKGKSTGESRSSSAARTDGFSGKSTIGRRSILECDINPYELMSLDAPDSSITLVNGQRIRIRPKQAAGGGSGEDLSTNYEDVDVKHPQQFKSGVGDALLSSPNETVRQKINEKESEANRFKSILKKRITTFNDTDTTSREHSPSPAHKSGSSYFYLPMPSLNSPRKKVQFLVENELVRQEPNNLIESDVQIGIVQLAFGEPAKVTLPEKKSDKAEEEHKEVEKKVRKLRRSVSERINHEPNKVVFHDTTALRSRRARGDARITFSETDLEKLDGLSTRIRKKSPPTPRPNQPPPPPPKTPPIIEEEPQERVVITNGIGTDSDANDFSKKVVTFGVDKESEGAATIKVTNGITNGEDSTKSDEEVPPPSVPPRKRSNSKQPVVNIVQSNNKIDSSQSPNKTIVQINGLTSAVHKLQIKNEFTDDNVNIRTVNVLENPQRRTSIMITGDDCYSTVNVNDDVPLYQSSVVVTDASPVITTRKSSTSVYISGNFIIPTADDLPVDATVEKIDEEVDDEKEYEVYDFRSSKEKNNENLLLDTFGQNNIPSSELLIKLLKDPVEAVKRNLVPHVCGKSDVPRRQRDKKRHKHHMDLNNLHVVDLQRNDLNKLSNFDDSLIKTYESILGDDLSSEHSSSTQYELMDAASECYTDHSNRSSITEEELANRTKFYELLADSAVVEVSENEDHHYESIKLNPDPIYEEIEIPPPLPSNPPPSSLLDDLQLDKEYTTRSIFEGASKYDILSYLVDAKERGIVQEDSYNYFGNQVDETKEPYNRASHMSTVSDSSEDNSLIMSNALIDEKATCQKPAEVERNDSGVGSETSKSSLSKYRTKQESSVSTCEDCEVIIETTSENEPLICRKCCKKRSERKEIIMEIVETEEKYSRDLQIILEEFYQPMLVAGLLTPEQLSAIFLNAEELLENSQGLAERLRDAVEIALEQGDEDLLNVNIGKLFLEAAPMLHGFETYCIRQGSASLLLASLEKDKELLRIFLRVSQMENTMLRRMNLNSFLMVPVQRVTKYPLLLARLYKVTPVHHETKDQLKDAQHKIELHLNHMNSETKDVPSKLWRRIGSSSGRRSSTEMDLVNIKLRKIAVDVLEWNHDEAKFALEGKLLFTQPTDNNWRKGRTIKLTPVNALLVINGKPPPSSKSTEESSLVFSRHSAVREAALLLVRDKNGRYSLLREPLYLDRCVIAADPAWQSYFEVQELMGKDTFIFKAEDEDQTKTWYNQLQYHAQGMGAWRKRRNALANIMINGMGLRS